ncbi:MULTISPECIES: phosphodiester glycosidase family protein [Clostridium]|uniref:phosphodiester glycosidase family protein n=1 Tax=Clostridium TaxID=1485 RepID=UPI00069F2E55|nr:MULTISPECIES: phosphodiester glycosidase family protein [Clostridium]KOF55581.1 exopolysaccharide biosynthesis protein [Clostridium sp. DMHC 10]MCD2347283.1 phosphodiester glycosidase family protein [Clostridium guangxiense]
MSLSKSSSYSGNKNLKRRNSKKKISKAKFIAYFFIFQILFGFLTAPWIVYYGPFNNLKKNIVGTAMSTFSHQFLATMFLSDTKIQKILNGDSVGVANYQNEDLNQINVNKYDSKIDYKTVKSTGFTGHVLIIHNPTKVKIGYSSKLGIQGEKTSQIAKNNNAMAAINGGGFQDKGANSTKLWTGTGAFPIGIIISKGKVVYPKSANENQKYYGISGITKNGVLVVGNYTIAELKQKGIIEAINFGPNLIINGVVQNRDTNGNNIDSQGLQPRTAIGQRKDGAIILLVVDGRQGIQLGASIKDVQKIMVEEHAYNAVNMDGGASTTMYFDGHLINNPCDKFGERTISTAIYVED